MHILIIANGIGHDVQEIHSADDDAARRTAKTEFEDLVKRRIAERGVQGEEAKYGVRTLAQGLGPRQQNIDMPMEEREARGIAEEQKNRHWEPRYLGEDAGTELTEQFYQKADRDGWVVRTYRVPSDEVREQWMFDRVMQEVKGADSVIVICGISHSNQLADRFRRDPSNSVEVEFWELKRGQ